MGGLRLLAMAVLGACSYAPVPGVAQDDAPTTSDTPVDLPPNAACFGQLGTVCLQDLPSGPFSIGGGTSTVTTEIAASCATVTSDTNVTGCVIAGTSITIDGTLLGVGSRPLILIATEGAIVVEDTIDVASHRDPAQRGAGAQPLGLCLGGVAPTGGSGGAGGSLVGVGGAGGGGLNGTLAAPNAATTPSDLRGGCAGTTGGNSTAVIGGHGGGAVWLISKVGITVNGRINASGAGGEGGVGDAVGSHGGAGGGSGGMIVFDAPMTEVTLAGVVAAIGGGGGGGNILAAAGGDGTEANLALATLPPSGGLGAVGQGGAGGTTGDGGPGSTNTAASACGGGGGTGFIRAFGAVENAGTVVPTITQL